MDTMFIIFIISTVIAGILGPTNILRSERKFIKILKYKHLRLILVILSVIYIGLYGICEKIKSDQREMAEYYYKEKTLYNDDELKKGIEELKQKEKKGLLTDADYGLYIVRYLESIDNTLKYSDSKNTREWITTYYDETAKIPINYGFSEWKSSESLIYESIVKEIKANFAERGFYNSSAETALLEVLKSERNKLLKTKINE